MNPIKCIFCLLAAVIMPAREYGQPVASSLNLASPTAIQVVRQTPIQGFAPTPLFFSKDSHKLYVYDFPATGAQSTTLHVIDTENPNQATVIPNFPKGTPLGAALSPAEDRLIVYALDGDSGSTCWFVFDLKKCTATKFTFQTSANWDRLNWYSENAVALVAPAGNNSAAVGHILDLNTLKVSESSDGSQLFKSDGAGSRWSLLIYSPPTIFRANREPLLLFGPEGTTWNGFGLAFLAVASSNPPYVKLLLQQGNGFSYLFSSPDNKYFVCAAKANGFQPPQCWLYRIGFASDHKINFHLKENIMAKLSPNEQRHIREFIVQGRPLYGVVYESAINPLNGAVLGPNKRLALALVQLNEEIGGKISAVVVIESRAVQSGMVVSDICGDYRYNGGAGYQYYMDPDYSVGLE